MSNYRLVWAIGLWVQYLLTGCINVSGDTTSQAAQDLRIHLWYGDEQHFGKLGHPQRWINLLGTVEAAHGLAQLSYILNGSAAQSLSWGEDGRRLAHTGDFNLDINRALLRTGTNTVRILAVDSLGQRQDKAMKVVYHHPQQSWPLPYTVDWQQAEDIQQAVQVVDGHWQLTRAGIRTLDPYYDRAVAIGDSTWKDYEVTTTVIFHSFTPPHAGPPTFGVSHAAIATRWPGHDLDDAQPHVKWHPLGATAEFRLTQALDSCRWRIFDGENIYVEDTINLRTIELSKPYHMKHRVETLADSTTLFSVKLWQADQQEPERWDLQAREKPDNISSGSALLIAHNTDVTFGNIRATPLP